MANTDDTKLSSKLLDSDDVLNDKVTNQIDRMRRNAYLNEKGLKPFEAHQLDLIFPNIIGKSSNLRHIPNDYARSAIFTARNKNEPRQTLIQEKLFHYNEHVSIIYTGIELRAEDDELIWLQILKYGEKIPFGEPFDFSIKDLVIDVGWHRNGRYYNKARECISRLKANEIMALNTKAYGKSGAISLIQRYETINDKDGKPNHYTVWLNPDLILLFAGHNFTSHAWEVYRELSPVGRRLADYIESHKHPYPLSLEKFRCICGSKDTTLRSWRDTVKKACDELQEAKIVQVAFVSADDQIRCISESN